MKTNYAENRERKIVRRRRWSSRNKLRLRARRHGPMRIYTPEEVRAFNIARGLI